MGCCQNFQNQKEESEIIKSNRQRIIQQQDQVSIERQFDNKQDLIQTYQKDEVLIDQEQRCTIFKVQISINSQHEKPNTVYSKKFSSTNSQQFDAEAKTEKEADIVTEENESIQEFTINQTQQPQHTHMNRFIMLLKQESQSEREAIHQKEQQQQNHSNENSDVSNSQIKGILKNKSSSSCQSSKSQLKGILKNKSSSYQESAVSDQVNASYSNKSRFEEKKITYLLQVVKQKQLARKKEFLEDVCIREKNNSEIPKLLENQKSSCQSQKSSQSKGILKHRSQSNKSQKSFSVYSEVELQSVNSSKRRRVQFSIDTQFQEQQKKITKKHRNKLRKRQRSHGHYPVQLQ